MNYVGGSFAIPKPSGTLALPYFDCRSSNVHYTKILWIVLEYLFVKHFKVIVKYQVRGEECTQKLQTVIICTAPSVGLVVAIAITEFLST